MPEKLEFHNIYGTLTRPDAGLILYRVAQPAREALNHVAFERSKTPSGAELRFIPHGEVTITLERLVGGWDPTHSLLEVWFGDQPCALHVLPAGRSSFSVRIPENAAFWQARARGLFDPSLARVLLPIDTETHLIAVSGDFEPPIPGQAPARRLLSYGSSITCGGAVLPSETYPMLLAKALGRDCLNFGFPGSARLEPELAVWLASLEWDVATLELGINVIDLWDAEVFAARAHEFIRIMAATGRWVFCTDLYTSYLDAAPNSKLEAYRTAVRDAVQSLNSSRCVYVPGNSLLDWSGLSIDALHPSAAGMQQLAAKWWAVIAAKLESNG